VCIFSFFAEVILFISCLHCNALTEEKYVLSINQLLRDGKFSHFGNIITCVELPKNCSTTSGDHTTRAEVISRKKLDLKELHAGDKGLIK
jgi:hypothetical protein